MIYKIQDTTLEGIANAIKAKSGTDKKIQVEDFEYEILNIDTGENTASAAESAKNAKDSADSANTSELAAAEHAGRAAVSEDNSEAWSSGTIHGEDIDGNHEAYQNNSKYWSEEAKAAAETAAVDAVNKVQELLEDEVSKAEAAAADARAAAETTVAEVQELLEDEVEHAKTAAKNAGISEDNASKHANDAAASAKSAEDIVGEAESNAESFISEVETRANNLITDAESQAESLIVEAETQAQAAAESATEAKYVLSTVTGQESEAWAIGTKTEVVIAEDGTEEFVTTPVDEGDPQYENNSKYWCDQAKLVVQDASSSVATANVYAQAEVTA